MMNKILLSLLIVASLSMSGCIFDPHWHDGWWGWGHWGHHDNGWHGEGHHGGGHHDD